MRTVTNPTQSQTSPAALVIYSLNCLSPARISYSRPTRRLIASLSGASPRASVLSSLSPAPHLAPPCYPYVYIYLCAFWGRLLSDGVRARLLIHACETTVTPAHDEPLEEQAARAPTNSGYARNGTLFPQVYRAAAPPLASKIHTPWFFSLALLWQDMLARSPTPSRSLHLEATTRAAEIAAEF